MTTFSVYGKVAVISGQLMLNWMTFLRYMHAVMYQLCDIGWIPILVQLESCMLGDEQHCNICMYKKVGRKRKLLEDSTNGGKKCRSNGDHSIE